MTEFQTEVDASINQYYGSIVFSRVDTRGEFAIYAAKFYDMIGDGTTPYVILCVPLPFAGRENETIANLRWYNLQTRKMKTFTTISGAPIRLRPQLNRTKKMITDPEFIVSNRTRDETKYTSTVCDINECFELTLFNNMNTRTKYQYHNKMSLQTCLDTFSCNLTRVVREVENDDDIELV